MTGGAFLEYEERDRLNDIVSGLPIFTLPRTRRPFLESAGLDRFVRHIDLGDNSIIVATQIINMLERFGELPERPTYHALGALLRPILNMKIEVSLDDRTFVAGLIARYWLIKDAETIENLRSEYKLPKRVDRTPTPEHVLKPINRDEIPLGPEFKKTIDDEKHLESIINSEDNFLDIYLMYGAIYCHQAVGQIEIPKGTAKGTGFMIGPDLMLTNQHVLKKEEYLQKAIVRFNYLSDAFNTPSTGELFTFQPDFYESSPAEELDYALVRLNECPLKEKARDYARLEDKSLPKLVHSGIHRGYLTIAPYYITQDEPVYILQHPQGKPMKVVMTENHVTEDMKGSRVHYVADTMDGSSGSPVFNKQWEVVALHHSGGPYPPESAAETLKRFGKAWKGKWRFNEGITMTAILEDFQKKDIYHNLPQG